MLYHEAALELLPTSKLFKRLLAALNDEVEYGKLLEDLLHFLFPHGKGLVGSALSNNGRVACAYEVAG